VNEAFLGIEIGGTKLQVALGDSNCQISKTWRSQVEPANGAEGIRKQIESTLSTLQKQHRPQGIGVGFGGPVDWKSGRICRSHQIAGWSDFDLSGWLQELSGCPVRVDNDANVAALGEAMHGAGKGFNPVFYVTLGSGVGGGLVVDGRIYHGATPGEAEIGHVRLDRAGNTVESRCSGWAVDARIRELKMSDPKSALALSLPREKGGEGRFLYDAIRTGDATAAKILSEVAEDLAFGLSHAVHLFHPEVVILGGGLSKVGEPLRAAVAKSLPKFVMEAFERLPRIEQSSLADGAVPVGAMALVLAGRV
jgi:glucokinase